MEVGRWENVGETPAVRKWVVEEGDGDLIETGDEIYLGYRGSYKSDEGGDSTGGQEIVFDDRERRVAPLCVTMGRDQTIPGLERALMTMREGERARIVVGASEAFGPMGNPHGFHGAGAGIPPNTDLLFDLRILHVERGVTLRGESCTPLEYARRLKLEGAEHYRSKRVFWAVAKWQAALRAAEQAGKKAGGEEEARATEEVTVLLHNNLAQACLALNCPRFALEATEKVLAVEPHNVKGLFRKGKAYYAQRRCEEARDAFQLALLHAPPDGTEAAALRKHLSTVEKALAIQTKKSDKLFGNLMGAGLRQQLYTDDDIERERELEKQARLRKCKYCGKEVEDVQMARHVIKYHDPSQQKKKKTDEKEEEEFDKSHFPFLFGDSS
mmetsp:Transcript_34400/g.96994  ORF Transcript_34400/g.96994 Transcript_34400/m.96994 type:complete len:384 (+) Transcript_34400:162-1313(+)|eukprot:CAMPEP_0119156580 /NCGR_PEP_ID=MMETSP1310-20130426/52330_1 /TAXON_ID=464262 /ORGANISM="Genus nov. species nov., Strain RCC2339" /LENGTH=383 /DNA_ID=CAMNT_0007149195 /DNA_START=61 /DNA_END=1212 /DNA_ORIENTATION=+